MAQDSTVNEDADDESDEAVEELEAKPARGTKKQKVAVNTASASTSSNPTRISRRKTIAISSATLAKVAESVEVDEETAKNPPAKRRGPKAATHDTSIQVAPTTTKATAKSKRLSLNQATPSVDDSISHVKPGRRKKQSPEKIDTYLYDDSDHNDQSNTKGGKRASKKAYNFL